MKKHYYFVYLIKTYNYLIRNIIVLIFGYFKGVGVQIIGNINISKSSFIGDYSTLTTGINGKIFISEDVSIGKNSWIAAGDGKITIGKQCLFGPRVSIVAQNHGILDITENQFLPWDRDSEPKNIVIGMRCSFGANVTILPGVVIGDYAIIAANSVVNKNVDSFSVFGGIPAKPLKKVYCSQIPVEQNLNIVAPHRHLSNRFF